MAEPAEKDSNWIAPGEALRQSEERYSAFIRNSSEAIWRFELEEPVAIDLPAAEQIDAFYRFSYLAECNEAMARLYGYERPEELVGLRLGQLMPRSDPANIRYLEAFIAAGHQLTDAESTELTRDGRTKYLLNSLRAVVENGRLLRAWGTSRDITLRKEAERRLQQSEEQFRLIVESASDYAIFTLDLAGMITTWNSGAEQILGYAAEEIVGRSGDQVFTPEDRAAREPAREMQTALEHNRAADERWHLKKNGARFWASGLLMPLRDEAGEIVGFLKILRDMTDRREADEARRTHTEEIVRLNLTLEQRVVERTAALSEANEHLRAFAHTVAHDLRAPARSVAQFCTLLREEHSGQLDADGVDLVRRIERAGHRMEALVASVLDYSRTLSADLKIEPVDVAELVADILERHHDAIARAGAEIEVARDLPVVLAHRGLLSQALENIVTNALKFIPPDRRPRVAIGGESGRQRARVNVRDNGIGIAPEHRQRIFGVFERVAPADRFAGTGIGLAIVKAAVERMGGAVGVDSTVGAGSVFWIELPTAAKP